MFDKLAQICFYAYNPNFSFAFVLSSLGAVAQSADWKIIQELIAKRNYSLAQLHLNALKVDNLTQLQIEERQFDLAVCAMELLMRMLLFSWKNTCRNTLQVYLLMMCSSI